MSDVINTTITKTELVCPIGEIAGKDNIAQGSTPVFSCEGACIRGEIARIAANMIAKEDGYKRACHGEALTAPHSAPAKWVKGADKVVLIDGCFMNCHGRIFENVLDKEQLVRFDALSVHKKYSDLMEIDSVPEEERKATARQVADAVLAQLEQAEQPSLKEQPAESCGTCS